MLQLFSFLSLFSIQALSNPILIDNNNLQVQLAPRNAPCNTDYPTQQCGGNCAYPCPYGFYCNANTDCVSQIGLWCMEGMCTINPNFNIYIPHITPVIPSTTTANDISTSTLSLDPTPAPNPGSGALGSQCSISGCLVSLTCSHGTCQNYWATTNFNTKQISIGWNVIIDTYGASNRAIVTDPIGTEQVLQIQYVAGSMDPANSPIGGTGFYAQPIDLSSATTITIEYSVFFPQGFNFVLGGKLPGIFGGHHSCSGGSVALDCFSTRLMWRAKGAGEIYLYLDKAAQVSNFCTALPNTICNPVYGISLARGAFSFATGQWTKIRQTITMNSFSGSTPVADGAISLWINDNPVPAIAFNQIVFRIVPTVLPLGIDFETFFGGSQSTYKTPITQYSYFKDISLSAY